MALQRTRFNHQTVYRLLFRRLRSPTKFCPGFNHQTVYRLLLVRTLTTARQICFNHQTVYRLLWKGWIYGKGKDLVSITKRCTDCFFRERELGSLKMCNVSITKRCTDCFTNLISLIGNPRAKKFQSPNGVQIALQAYIIRI